MKTTKATRIEFVAGFIDGLKMFEAGATLESIADVKSGSAFDRGLFAASEALNGWIDGAEHEARKCGFAREEARIEIAALIRPTVAQ